MKLFCTLLLLLGCSTHATNYFVATNGSDSAAGTSVTAPWQKISKAVTTVAAGDTVYFAPGAYRQNITLSATWNSRVWFIGDPMNSQGFTNNAGALITPGIVRWTGYTNGDTAVATDAPLLNLNGKNNLGIANFYMNPYTGSTSSGIEWNGLNSTNVAVSNCVIVTMRSYPITVWSDSSTRLFLTVDNCDLINYGANGQGFSFAFWSVAGADYDADIVLRNNRVFCQGNAAMGIARLIDGGGGVAGGLRSTNNLYWGYTAWTINRSSTNTIKCVSRNDIFIGGTVGLAIQDAGQVDIDYAYVVGSTSPTDGVAAIGANSQSNNWNYAAFDFGSTRRNGLGLRPDWSLLSDSPLVGAGVGNIPAVDTHRNARPNPNSRGAYEVHPAPQFSFGSQ